MTEAPAPARNRRRLLVILLSALALLAGLYFGLRFAGWSMEVDSSRQTLTADGILQTGQLINNSAYSNGFGYGAQLAFLSQVTGLSVQVIQLGSSLWIFVVALVAFITYREFLGGTVLPALGVFLLFVQPDFLFYILRDSHEKITWAFALLMLFLLVRSYRQVENPLRLLVTIALFYLVFWAMITSNVYFASTFINAIVIGLCGGWVVERLGRRGKKPIQKRTGALQRLILISLACIIMVYVFIIYTYRPAYTFFTTYIDMIDRIGLLLFGGQAETPAAYRYLEQAWRSSGIYLALTGIQWLIVFVSLIAWAIGLTQLSKENQNHWLLWLMYSSFAGLVAYGLFADYSGVFSSNLQLRMFTPFALFSSPLAVGLIHRGLRRLGVGWRRPVAALLVALAVYAAGAAMLKASNDPTLSNQWLFYAPSEIHSQEWLDTHVKNSQVWVDTDPHLAQAFYFWEGYQAGGNQLVTGKVLSPVPYTLISQLTLLRVNRSGISLPTTGDQNRLYDNGIAQLYHLRALTPYQH